MDDQSLLKVIRELLEAYTKDIESNMLSVYDYVENDPEWIKTRDLLEHLSEDDHGNAVHLSTISLTLGFKAGFMTACKTLNSKGIKDQ